MGSNLVKCDCGETSYCKFTIKFNSGYNESEYKFLSLSLPTNYDFILLPSGNIYIYHTCKKCGDNYQQIFLENNIDFHYKENPNGFPKTELP